MASDPITSWQIDGEKVEIVADFIFLGSKITACGGCNHKIKRLAPWMKSYDKPRQCIKRQRHHFADTGLSSQSCGFSSSHVRMWKLDHKEGCTRLSHWTTRNNNLHLLIPNSQSSPPSPPLAITGLFSIWLCFQTSHSVWSEQVTLQRFLIIC